MKLEKTFWAVVLTIMALAVLLGDGGKPVTNDTDNRIQSRPKTVTVQP